MDIFKRVLRGCACSTVALAGSLQAQESFVVSGPLDIYVDLATQQEHTDYTFTATVTYEASQQNETYLKPAYEQSFFYDTVLSIEYTIYDADGGEVEAGVELGEKNNMTAVLNDLDLSDATEEQMYWYGDDYLSTLNTEAHIGFYDAVGQIISDVTAYPLPPASREEFDYGGGFFYEYNQDSGEGFEAWGSIAEITLRDPVTLCFDQAATRGDYRECFAMLFQELRNDELSAQEKENLREIAAKLRKARWEKLASLLDGDSDGFERFRDMVDAISAKLSRLFDMDEDVLGGWNWFDRHVGDERETQSAADDASDAGQGTHAQTESNAGGNDSRHESEADDESAWSGHGLSKDKDAGWNWGGWDDHGDDGDDDSGWNWGSWKHAGQDESDDFGFLSRDREDEDDDSRSSAWSDWSWGGKDRNARGASKRSNWSRW